MWYRGFYSLTFHDVSNFQDYKSLCRTCQLSVNEMWPIQLLTLNLLWCGIIVQKFWKVWESIDTHSYHKAMVLVILDRLTFPKNSFISTFYDYQLSQKDGEAVQKGTAEKGICSWDNSPIDFGWIRTNNKDCSFSPSNTLKIFKTLSLTNAQGQLVVYAGVIPCS